jgi:hypothetical protein
MVSEKWEQLEGLIAKYPDLPPEAIFKEDLLRQGISFSEDALKVASGFKPKAYFIFSFDLVPIGEMQNQENLVRLRRSVWWGVKETFAESLFPSGSIRIPLIKSPSAMRESLC